MELWLVRHGETTWNAARRFQGALDAPLSARGEAQARALAARLQAVPFDALYTSPLRRARDTAAACEAVLGLQAVVVEDLRELALGAWEGRTLDAVLAEDGDRYRRWAEAPADHCAPDGEPIPALAERVLAAFDRLAARHPNGRVLVVSHGGAIACAACRWLGQPLNGVWRTPVANASITRVALPPGAVLALNETAHLAAAEEAGVP